VVAAAIGVAGSVLARFFPGSVPAVVVIFASEGAFTIYFVAISSERSFGVVVCSAWAFEIRCFFIAALSRHYIVRDASILAYTWTVIADVFTVFPPAAVFLIVTFEASIDIVGGLTALFILSAQRVAAPIPAITAGVRKFIFRGPTSTDIILPGEASSTLSV
jgi:hypothetical protein